MNEAVSSIDVGCALALPVAAVALALAYGARLRSAGKARFARVDAMGGSALVGKGAMEAVYWALQPVGRALVRGGVTANAVTAASLATGAAAGAAIGAGFFGLAAMLSTIASVCDALDGLVARLAGTASDAGEVLDAAVDRYVEFFFLAGAVYYFRGSSLGIALALAAVVGAFMVSYSTAKAEALGVEPPRGAMRRTERAVYLTAGAMLVPYTTVAVARLGLPTVMADAPLAIALGVVGVVGNISATRRLASIADDVRRSPSRSRDAHPAKAARTEDETDAHDAPEAARATAG